MVCGPLAAGGESCGAADDPTEGWDELAAGDGHRLHAPKIPQTDLEALLPIESMRIVLKLHARGAGHVFTAKPDQPEE